MAWSIGTPQSGVLAFGSPATSAVLTAPAGIVDGAFIFAAICADIPAGSDAGVASIPGFTQITSNFLPPGFKGSTRLTTLYKIASGESGNYTASWAAAAQAAWGIVAITGNKSTSPIDKSATAVDTNGTATSIQSPSLTGLAAADDLLLNVFASCGGDSPYTPPASGLTTIVETNTSNSDQAELSFGYQVLSSSGATTQYTFAQQYNNPMQAASIAVLAAAGGGGGSTVDDVAMRAGASHVITLMRERASGLFEPVREILKPWRPVMA